MLFLSSRFNSLCRECKIFLLYINVVFELLLLLLLSVKPVNSAAAAEITNNYLNIAATIAQHAKRSFNDLSLYVKPLQQQ